MSKVDPGFSSEPAGQGRRAKTRTLEFDLGLQPSRKTRRSSLKSKPGAAKSPVADPGLASDRPPVFRSVDRRRVVASQEADATEPGHSISEPQTDPVIQSTASRHAEDLEPAIEPKHQEPTMNRTQPAPLNVKKTIERQSREQQAMSHVLNGVAVALICGLVLVASLAGLGGYVVYKQLRNQSATLALLETNTLERFADLEGRLVARNRELSELQQETNLRLTHLQGQFDQYRSQTTQAISLLTSANARLERRLAEYRQELLRQEQLVSLNEASARRVR